MNFENLKCFISLAECLNFTKAAEKEHITQTSMSRKINSIEDELGVLLLYRDNHQVELTEAGREFYYSAKKLLTYYDHAVQTVQNIHHGYSNSIKVGVGVYEHELLSPFLADYLQLHPGVKVSCTQYGYYELIHHFEQNTLDLILTSDQYFHDLPAEVTNNTDQLLISDENWSLIVHKDHSLATLDSVPPGALNGETLVTMSNGSVSQIIDRYKSLAVFQDIIHVNSHETKLLMVRSKLGVCLLPSFVSIKQYPELCKKTFQVPYKSRRFYLLCKKDNPNLHVHEFYQAYVNFLHDI